MSQAKYQKTDENGKATVSLPDLFMKVGIDLTSGKSIDLKLDVADSIRKLDSFFNHNTYDPEAVINALAGYLDSDDNLGLALDNLNIKSGQTVAKNTSLIVLLYQVNSLQSGIVSVVCQTLKKKLDPDERNSDLPMATKIINNIRKMGKKSKPRCLTIEFVKAMQSAPDWFKSTMIENIAIVTNPEMQYEVSKRLVKLLSRWKNFSSKIITCITSLDLSIEDKSKLESKFLDSLRSIESIDIKRDILSFVGNCQNTYSDNVIKSWFSLFTTASLQKVLSWYPYFYDVYYITADASSSFAVELRGFMLKMKQINSVESICKLAVLNLKMIEDMLGRQPEDTKHIKTLIRSFVDDFKAQSLSCAYFIDRLIKVLKDLEKIDSSFLTWLKVFCANKVKTFITNKSINPNEWRHSMNLFKNKKNRKFSLYIYNNKCYEESRSTPFIHYFSLLAFCTSELERNLGSLYAFSGASIIVPVNIEDVDEKNLDTTLHYTNWFRTIVNTFCAEESLLVKSFIKRRLEAAISLEQYFLNGFAVIPLYEPKPLSGLYALEPFVKQSLDQDCANLSPEWQNLLQCCKSICCNSAYFIQFNVKVLHILEFIDNNDKDADFLFSYIIIQISILLGKKEVIHLEDLVPFLPCILQWIVKLRAQVLRSSEKSKLETLQIFFIFLKNLFARKEFLEEQYRSLTKDVLIKFASISKEELTVSDTLYRLVGHSYAFLMSFRDVCCDIALAFHLTSLCLLLRSLSPENCEKINADMKEHLTALIQKDWPREKHNEEFMNLMIGMRGSLDKI